MLKVFLKKYLYPLYFVIKKVYEIIFLFNNIRLNFLYNNFYKNQKGGSLTSPHNLVYLEKKYFGLQVNVPRNKISSVDPRTKEELDMGGMTGGDKMFWNNYKKFYSFYLSKFSSNSKINICEVGILNGSGIAILSEIYKNSQIYGLDVDLLNFQNNFQRLKNLGAFNIEPKIFEYDQFKDNKILLSKIFDKAKLSIIIDDGIHYDDAILNTFMELEPYFDTKFVYFIEDNLNVHHELRRIYKNYNIVKCSKLLTVVHNL